MDIPRIRQLDTSVVNRIAAGEIIIAPANALKEMLENSIDADSTMIDILVKDGGLKLLQITDNGHGIDKEDLGLLCERFTTSKLRTFDDLSSIATYGFRGEALASISHIAHLSVTTKTKNTTVAYRAQYENGKLVAPTPRDSAQPKPIAGKDGTQLTVEDLFYNVPSRIKALKSKNDEFSKILDVVGRYAVHTEGVGFSCKKFGDPHASLSTRSHLSLKERIRVVFGSGVANELLEIEIAGNEDFGLLKVTGAISNANFSNKKRVQPVFFINNRLVSCDSLRRAINSTYSTFLPKGSSAFVYLNLHIQPENVDVNVHPTKREVKFLNEDEIIELISKAIYEKLNSVDTSRTFKTQSVLPNQLASKRDRQEYDSNSPIIKKYRQENKLVRVDASQSKINQFLTNQSQFEYNESNIAVAGDESENELEEHEDVTGTRLNTRYMEVSKDRKSVNLSSIMALRSDVEGNIDPILTAIFSGHSYIGVVDSTRRLAALQYDVNLYLIDYASILYEFFYQIGLSEFSNYGALKFKKPISLYELLNPIYEDSENLPEDGISQEELITNMINMKAMLEEYFCIEIDDSDPNDPKLCSIPLLLKNYEPPFSKLSFFLYRLGARVDFSEEASCLEGIIKQIALFFIPDSIPNLEEIEDDLTRAELEQSSFELNEKLENVLFPAIKRRFLATQNLLKDVVQVADLPGLYRVFERC